MAALIIVYDDDLLLARGFSLAILHFLDLLQYLIVHFPLGFALLVEFISFFPLVFDGLILLLLARLGSILILLSLLFLAPEVNGESNEAKDYHWD